MWKKDFRGAGRRKKLQLSLYYAREHALGRQAKPPAFWGPRRLQRQLMR